MVQLLAEEELPTPGTREDLAVEHGTDDGAQPQESEDRSDEPSPEPEDQRGRSKGTPKGPGCESERAPRLWGKGSLGHSGKRSSFTLDIASGS